MSDRVAVNHCVIEKLQSDLDIQLLELKCNVHPLEGVSKKPVRQRSKQKRCIVADLDKSCRQDIQSILEMLIRSAW